MKKLILSLTVLIGGIVAGYSQQIPLYSLYHQNRMIYNPANTGFNGSPELYIMYRKQWTDFVGAPETRAASFDMRIKQGGIGAYVFNDIEGGIFNRWGGYLSYAYHLPFKNDMHKFSIGLSAGIQDLRITSNDIFVQDPDDPILDNNLGRGMSFDPSGGVHYNVSKPKSDSSKHAILNLSIGLSVLSFYGVDMKFLNNNDEATYYRPKRHYIGMLSNKFMLANEKVMLEPLVLARLTEALNWQIDAGLSIGYKDWVWVSGMYRYDYGVTLGGGFKVHDAIKLGYAYDMALNNIKDYTNGTHEVMLGITFGKRKDAATQAALDSLKKQVAQQDSLFKASETEQDSILNEIESMQDELDSLNSVLASGEFLVEEDPYDGFDKQMLEDLEKLTEDEWKAKYGEDEYDQYSEYYQSEDYEKAADYENMDEAAWKEKWGDENYNEYLSDGEKNERINNLERRVKYLEDQLSDALKNFDSRVDDLKNEMQEERTRIVSEEDLEVKRGPAIGDYFMVVGSFRIEQNSYDFQETLKGQGYDAGVVYDKKRKWYYVYIAQPNNLKKGLEELYKLREDEPQFHDAWIHIMRKRLR